MAGSQPGLASPATPAVAPRAISHTSGRTTFQGEDHWYRPDFLFMRRASRCRSCNHSFSFVKAPSIHPVEFLMCGISGILDKEGRIGPDKLCALTAAMANTMQHRGPDDRGLWLSPDKRVALAHRRLSIIDTSAAGHQPMGSPSGRGAITYNGELYNYHQLRAELEQTGVRFTSKSDTEVLLACIERWGTGALPKLDAMFAFGHYDLERRLLLLARDIFGEKPLYYLDTSEYFAFASELHALSVLPGFDASVSIEAIASYLSFQYVPSPATIYRGTKKLPPGSWLSIDAAGKVRIERYFSFTTSELQKPSRSPNDLADELEDLLVNTLRSRLISDVPLGAFLSGGVDSSTVVAIITKRLGVPLKTYSIGFKRHRDSEHLEAAEVSQHLGSRHHERVLSPDVIELGSHIGAVLDEPNGDTSCLPTYLLSGFARESVKVALSGDGGDELFGGYGRYFNTVDEWTRKNAGDRSLSWWHAGDVYLSNRILVFPDDALAEVMGEIPPAFAAALATMRREITDDPRPLLNVIRELDARTYMPGAVLAKVDRMSMQHSLEVRAPLLGIEIAKFAMRLSAEDCYAGGQGKLVLKCVAERYLPPEWMRRPKRGFGLPMDTWGAQALLPVLRQLLLDPRCRLAEWIPAVTLRKFVGHLERHFHAYQAWSLFILETWLRTHPATPATTQLSVDSAAVA